MPKKKVLIIVLTSAALVLVNIILIWPLFLGEYDKNTGSIGVAHIINGRYINRFWNRGWNPFWYGGFPNHLIYPLLAPTILALVQKASIFLSMARVYRTVVAAAYVLTPLTLFFLVSYFTGRRLIVTTTAIKRAVERNL